MADTAGAHFAQECFYCLTPTPLCRVTPHNFINSPVSIYTHTWVERRADRVKCDMALIGSGHRTLRTFFISSVKRKLSKKPGAVVEPRPQAPQAGMKTNTLKVSWLLEIEIFETVKCYPYYFIRTNREG